MSVKTHRLMVYILGCVGFLPAVPAALAWGYDLDRFFYVGLLLLGASLALGVFTLAFLYLVPAFCDAPGCRGWARPQRIKGPDFEWHLQYRCNACGMICEIG